MILLERRVIIAKNHKHKKYSFVYSKKPIRRRKEDHEKNTPDNIYFVPG